MQRVDPEKLEEWRYQLELPLPGTETRGPSEAQVESEGADFMATMMMHQQMQQGG